MTWQDAGIDAHSIHGPVRDLERIGALIRTIVQQCALVRRRKFREQFAAKSEYSLMFSMRDDGFDAASLIRI